MKSLNGSKLAQSQHLALTLITPPWQSVNTCVGGNVYYGLPPLLGVETTFRAPSLNRVPSDVTLTRDQTQAAPLVRRGLSLTYSQMS